MPGTIRTFLGMGLLILAGSVDPNMPDPQFFLTSLALAIPGALIGFSGVRALNRSGVA